jgi:hypothetical protein
MEHFTVANLTDIKPRLVWVQWVDPHAESGWMEFDEVCDPPGCAESCGFVIHDEDDYVVLALSLDYVNNHVNGYIAIPKVLIKSMHSLTLLEGANACE